MKNPGIAGLTKILSPSESRAASWLSIMRAFAYLILFFFSAQTLAGSYTLLPSQGFQRNSGQPVTKIVNFPAIDTNGSYSFNVYNGGLEDSELTGEKVSSSTIVLNGTQIFGPSEFNQNVTTLSKTVSLESGNELLVVLKGKTRRFNCYRNHRR